jgi:hypothetical protein
MNTSRNPFAGEGGALPSATLPLWQWAATKAAIAPSKPFHRAVRRIATKAQISSAHAAVLAELMGHTQEISQ